MSNELERVSGIGPISSISLSKAGVKTIEDIASSKPEDLAWIKGIGIVSAKKNNRERIQLTQTREEHPVCLKFN